MAPAADKRHVVRSGRAVTTPFEVHTWEHHGLRFQGRFRTETRAVMAHWTAAENPVEAMFNNMATNKSVFGEPSPLSVHFAIDQKGKIYQLADTEVRAAHCRGRDANSWSIGIEFVGRGSAMHHPHKGFARPRVTELIHGRPMVYDELLSPQIDAGVKLIEFLCDIYKLPLVVPEDRFGLVNTDELTAEEASEWRGVLGHMHCDIKPDPGVRLLRAIQGRGKQKLLGGLKT